MPDPALVIGPGGALVILLYIVRELWIAHKAEDARKDKVIDTFPVAIAALTAVVTDVAEREKARGKTRADDT
jgi:hypothetical protein